MHTNTLITAIQAAKQAVDTADQTIEAIKAQYGEAASEFVLVVSGALIHSSAMTDFINMLSSEIEDPMARLHGELIKVSMNSIVKNLVTTIVCLSQEAYGLTDNLTKEYFDIAKEIADKVIDSVPKSDKG